MDNQRSPYAIRSPSVLVYGSGLLACEFVDILMYWTISIGIIVTCDITARLNLHIAVCFQLVTLGYGKYKLR